MAHMSPTPRVPQVPRLAPTRPQNQRLDWTYWTACDADVSGRYAGPAQCPRRTAPSAPPAGRGRARACDTHSTPLCGRQSVSITRFASSSGSCPNGGREPGQNVVVQLRGAARPRGPGVAVRRGCAPRLGTSRPGPRQRPRNGGGQKKPAKQTKSFCGGLPGPGLPACAGCYAKGVGGGVATSPRYNGSQSGDTFQKHYLCGLLFFPRRHFANCAYCSHCSRTAGSNELNATVRRSPRFQPCAAHCAARWARNQCTV